MASSASIYWMCQTLKVIVVAGRRPDEFLRFPTSSRVESPMLEGLLPGCERYGTYLAKPHDLFEADG